MRRYILPWLTDPSPAGLLMILSILAAVVGAALALGGPARAETPADAGGAQMAAEALRVEAAIERLVRVAPRRRIARSPEMRRELARHIAETAEAHDLPPLLWTAIVYRESSFRIAARGELGEVGLVQIHGRAAEGCDLETSRGQLECGASWLARCRDICGGRLDHGFALYASGRVCRPDTSHLRGVVRDRWRLWARLEAGR